MPSSVMAPSQEDLKSLTLLMASAKLRPGESQEEDLTEIELHPWLRTPPEHGESDGNDDDSGVDSNDDDDEDSVTMNELRPDEEVLTVVPERFEDGELVPELTQMRKKQPSSDPTARSRNASQVEDQAANTLLETVGEFEDHHAPMGSTPLGQLPEPDPNVKEEDCLHLKSLHCDPSKQWPGDKPQDLQLQHMATDNPTETTHPPPQELLEQTFLMPP